MSGIMFIFFTIFRGDFMSVYSGWPLLHNQRGNVVDMKKRRCWNIAP